MRVVLLGVALLAAVAQGAPPQLAAELSRVRAEAATSVSVDERAPLVARLDRAAASLEFGRGYLALYLIESPFESVAASSFAGAARVSSQDDFERVWKETGSPVIAAPASGARPAIVDALAAIAEGRAAATYQASRPYGADAGVAAGLYYLGESRALVQFAALARGLRWPAPARRPSFRSIAPEIAALDATMTRQYESMARDEHASYISASAALKVARSLNDDGRYDGALFEYLLSRYLFAPLRGPAAAEATVERVAGARAALTGGADHSIAELFLQLADEGVSGSVPAQRRGAAAALDDILPAYFAAVAPPATTTSTTAAAAATTAPEVTITLVRWPFT
jgi:hypothetical protein